MIDLWPSADMIYVKDNSGGRKIEITTKQLDHNHELVAGTFDKFEMGEVIEKRIPKGKNQTFPNQIKSQRTNRHPNGYVRIS